MAAKISDILREDVSEAKLVIGIFMSPFDVHFNRAPIDASITSISHHPGRGPNAFMTAMHWRVLRRRKPYYAGSVHIVQNERLVTRFAGEYRGKPLAAYVVQIGARTVSGIDSYYEPGQDVKRGMIFGMIRVGSQVDLIAPRRDGFVILVRPGDRVRAGETILIS